MPADRNASLVSVALDPSQSAPLYVQLFEQVRDQILEGRLKPRQRLPSTRALAKDLDVSRTTTLGAYEQLMSEGYIEGQAGSGAYVAAMLPEDLLLVRPPGDRMSTEAQVAPAPDEAEAPPTRQITEAPPFDSGALDARLFPFSDWSRLLAKAWRWPSADLLHHVDAFGHLPLRQAIARHLRELRGVSCSSDQVVITTSASQSVALVIKTLLERGDTVFVEDPGYPTTGRALHDVGASVVPVPVDEHGFVPPSDVNRTDAALAAIITPSRQYPLGMTMPLTRRLELLKWAEDTGAWIIEDDYDSEYRYIGRPLSALMSLDRNERVIYLGSFSKTMFRSLRLGFVILPHDLIGPMKMMLAKMRASASMIAQPALAEFMSSGLFAAHIRRMRRLYSERQKVLQAELDAHFGDLFDAPRQSAGMHIPAFFSNDLRNRMSDVEAARRLREAGLVAEPLSTHYQAAPPRQGLLLGFAAFEPDEIRQAAKKMADALA